jgi:hypothetical protein
MKCLLTALSLLAITSQSVADYRTVEISGPAEAKIGGSVIFNGYRVRERDQRYEEIRGRSLK